MWIFAFCQAIFFLKKMSLLMIEVQLPDTTCDEISFNSDLDSARLFSAVMFETYSSYQKAVWIAATDYYVFLSKCAISIATIL